METKASKTSQTKLNVNVNELNQHFVKVPEELVNTFEDNYSFQDLSPNCENVFTLNECQ